MTRPFFSKDRISDFELFDRHADQVISKMKERFKEGIAVDVQDVLSRFTMDTATEFLFGQDVKSLSGDLPYPSTCKKSSPRTHPSDKFAFAFNRAQDNMFLRILWQIVAIGRLLGGYSSPRTRRSQTSSPTHSSKRRWRKRKQPRGYTRSTGMTRRCSITSFTRQTVRGSPFACFNPSGANPLQTSTSSETRPSTSCWPVVIRWVQQVSGRWQANE
jgi:hypothetical protein